MSRSTVSRRVSEFVGVALFAAMMVWIIILVSHLSFRRHHAAKDLPVRMPFFPWMQYAGLALIAAVQVTMGFDENLYVSWVYGVPWLAALSVAYFVWKARRRAAIVPTAVS